MYMKFAVNVIVNLSNYILIYLKIVTVGVALACVAGGINVGVLHCFRVVTRMDTPKSDCHLRST